MTGPVQAGAALVPSGGWLSDPSDPTGQAVVPAGGWLSDPSDPTGQAVIPAGGWAVPGTAAAGSMPEAGTSTTDAGYYSPTPGNTGILAPVPAPVPRMPLPPLPGYVSFSGGLNRLYDGIEALLPGVQHNLVMLETFYALDEFCTRSTYWQELVNWTLMPGYSLLDFSTLVSAGTPAWILQVAGLRQHARLPPNQVLDNGDLSQVRTGTALVALRPLQLQDSLVPAVLIDHWAEAIRDGTLGRLYAHPGKPYTSPALAQRHEVRFRAAIRTARAATARFNLRQTSPYPYFAAGKQNGRVGSGLKGGYAPNTAVFDDTNADETSFS